MNVVDAALCVCLKNRTWGHQMNFTCSLLVTPYYGKFERDDVFRVTRRQKVSRRRYSGSGLDSNACTSNVWMAATSSLWQEASICPCRGQYRRVTSFAYLCTSTTCFLKAAVRLGFESRVKAFLQTEQRLTPCDSIKWGEETRLTI